MDYSEIKRQTEINYDLGIIRKKIKSSQYLYNKKSKRYFEITKFENNKLSISPQGGGFVKSIDVTQQSFINDFRKGKFDFKNNMPFEWKKVKLFHDHWLVDNSPIGYDGNLPLKYFIEGYVTEHKWNGWSIPMVELDQIEKFNEIQKKTMDGESSSIFKIIDEDSIQIRMFDEDELIGIEASYINVNNKQIKVFDLSLGWTWSEEDL
jgi:hypothetical protein